MSAQTLAVVRDRVASVCAAAPFAFEQAATPFSFDLQPTTAIDAVFRLEAVSGVPIGGFNYSEERNDLIHVWVARKHKGDPEAMYRQLLTDVSSLRAAVIRDGLQNGGDYGVPDDGGGATIDRAEKAEFAMLELILPVNFEATV